MNASIIIPTYNRHDALIQTLEALQKLDYDLDLWEVIVVDDGSTDGSEAIIKEKFENTQLPLSYLKQDNAGPAKARNYGAKVACGKVLIFIDNDIEVKPDFVTQHLRILEQNPGCWVGGRITHPAQLRSTPFGRYRDAAWEEFHKTQGGKGIVEIKGLSGANSSIPADDFHRLGGFDENFSIASAEDWELSQRALKSGIRLLYNPDIVVLHNDWAVSLPRFCERQRLYSISSVLLWKKYGEESPQVLLVNQSAPIKWKQDARALIAKKILKQTLATKLGSYMVNSVCRYSERIVPDSAISHRAYNLAVAIAIFRGVREGWKRYKPS